MFHQQQQIRTNSSPKQGTPMQGMSPQPFYPQQSLMAGQSLPFRKGSSQQNLQIPQNMLKQQNNNKSTISEPESLGSVCRAFGPSTPQKMNVFSSQQSLRGVVGNAASIHHPDSSFRNSSQKKAAANFLPKNLASESPQLKQINGNYFTPTQLQFIQHQQSQALLNKENGVSVLDSLKRQSTDAHEASYHSVDQRQQNLAAENKKLNEFIQRQFKEKQEMKAHIDRLQAEKEQRDAVDLGALQERVERMAQVVESQAQEIEQWKLKYEEARIYESNAQFEDQREMIEQMEKQIMVVVEENERLNNLKEEMEVAIRNHASMDQQLEDLENQLATQRENEQLYQDEIVTQRNEKQKLQEELDQLRAHQNVDMSGTPHSFIRNLRGLEQQMETLTSTFEQELEQQRNSFENRIRELQRENDFLREQGRGVTAYPEIGEQMQTIRETIVSSIKQFYCLTAVQK